MKLFTVLGILFYAVVPVLIGCVLIAFSFNLLNTQDISVILEYTQSGANTRIVIGLSGLLLILISVSFAQLILGRFQRERTIAFATTSGQVTIALSAVEDLIKRIAGGMPEIKELRPDVIATKKGIAVDLRVVLRSEASIPELTSRLQEITRSKIQEVLGIDEEIIVKIHVAKIISSEERDRKKRDTGKDEPPIPYGGYNRI